MAAFPTELETETVKLLGPNGQINLGEEFAGRYVLVAEREPGVWLIRTATVTPDNAHWLLDNPEAMRDLEQAIEWEKAHPVDTSNAEELLKKWRAEAQD